MFYFLSDAADLGSWRFVCRLIMLKKKKLQIKSSCLSLEKNLVLPFIRWSLCRNTTSVTKTNENHTGGEIRLSGNVRHKDAAAVHVKSCRAARRLWCNMRKFCSVMLSHPHTRSHTHNHTHTIRHTITHTITRIFLPQTRTELFLSSNRITSGSQAPRVETRRLTNCLNNLYRVITAAYFLLLIQ